MQVKHFLREVVSESESARLLHWYVATAGKEPPVTQAEEEEVLKKLRLQEIQGGCRGAACSLQCAALGLVPNHRALPLHLGAAVACADSAGRVGTVGLSRDSAHRLPATQPLTGLLCRVSQANCQWCATQAQLCGQA